MLTSSGPKSVFDVPLKWRYRMALHTLKVCLSTLIVEQQYHGR